MKSILIVTDVDFWQRGSGNRIRIAALLRYLSENFAISVIYTGDIKPPTSYPHAAILPIGKANAKSSKYCINLIRTLFKKISFKVCIIEYIHQSYFLNYLPPGTLTILDTHDIQSEKNKSFNAFNVQSQSQISYEKEIALFKVFNYVLLICDADYELLQHAIDKNKLIVIPHSPFLVTERTHRSVATSIGFIGSEYRPNVDAVQVFLTTVWPEISKQHDIQFNIYGNIYRFFPASDLPSVRFRGFTTDIGAVYNEVDIMINPVRFGAGLKIKNIEALGYGLPLLTTSHGARGLEQGKNTAFVVADDFTQQISWLNTLITDIDTRIELSRNGRLFIQENFNGDKCYQELVTVIKEHS